MSVYFASFLIGKQDPYNYRCEPYERVANETTTRQMHSLFAYTHCRVCLFGFLSTRLCPISLFPIILTLFVHILSLYYGNINTDAIESLQTSYDHYKCVAVDQNGLRTASVCVFTSFRNMFLKFAIPCEQPRIYTNTIECKAITMRPLRFGTELQRTMQYCFYT